MYRCKVAVKNTSSILDFQNLTSSTCGTVVAGLLAVLCRRFSSYRMWVLPYEYAFILKVLLFQYRLQDPFLFSLLILSLRSSFSQLLAFF
jgi:hypothetical protein